jgi:hypothetical protein
VLNSNPLLWRDDIRSCDKKSNSPCFGEIQGVGDGFGDAGSRHGHHVLPVTRSLLEKTWFTEAAVAGSLEHC